MPKWSFFLNKEQDKVILDYGEILKKQGMIEGPINRYKLSKYIFSQFIKNIKETIFKNRSTIIDEKTPIEKEQVAPVQKENSVQPTEMHEAYKQIR